MRNNQPSMPFEELMDALQQENNPSSSTVYRLNDDTIVFHDDVEPESTDTLIKLLHQIDKERSAKTGAILSSMFDFIESDFDVMNSIISAVKLSNPIHLFISTAGGDVVEAFRIINAIERLDTPVFTYADGMVASAGVWLLISGEKRFSFAHASLMLHNVLVEISGDYNNVLAKVKHTDKLQEYLYDMLLNKTKLTKEKIDHIFKYDYFFDPKEALEMGIIDEILGKEVKKTENKPNKKSKTTTTTKLISSPGV